MATTLGNILSYDGNLYLNTTPNYSSANMSIPLGIDYRRQSGINAGVDRGWLTPIGMQQSQQQPTQSATKFTPNAYTQSQLSGMGGGAVPQWMMNMYSNKIGQMGGNANNPPFGVTQSGFPGVGGKSAPTQGK